MTDDQPTPEAPHWRGDTRPSKAPLIFFLLLLLLLLSGTLILLEYNRRHKPFLIQNPQPEKSTTLNNTSEIEKETAEQTLKDTRVQPTLPSITDPIDLITAIGNAMANKDIQTAEKLIGQKALDSQTAERLHKLANSNNFHLRTPSPVREVGELELNKRSRYALELDNREPGRDRIYFDLLKDGKNWSIEKLTLPPADGEPIPKALIVDSLGITDSFLLAALEQNFTLAREFTSPATVTDPALAALCILFEEGNYRLRKEKPLRSVIQKDDTASYLAHVEAADGTQVAQFAINLKKEPNNPNWVITELNLDQLLSDYATRVAGGDVYYTPLIKNPAGGDTLVLYFDFAADQFSPRTERQLAIVALILKTDTRKKIHLSGHTDAIGSANFNQQLSARRAQAVREYLIKSGVAENQIIAQAKGLTEPRRPNTTDQGEDNPDGRRANRRTEIYLDF